MSISYARKGFTLVELIVVIVVIAVLTTIVALGLTKYQQDSRDARRNASAVSLAESLEKYYDTNGEYPSCSAMTDTVSAVQQTLGISAEALKLPNSTIDNALTCTDITTSTSGDKLAYVGDGTSKCTGTIACRFWTLKYKEEASGQIKSIQSRRSGSVAAAPIAPVSQVVASISGSNALGTTPAVLCSNGSIQYRIDSQTNDGTWATGTWGATLTRTLAASEGSQYGFRTVTRCVLNDGTEGDLTTSAVAETIRGITTPAAPVVTSNAGGSSGTLDTVTWSWNAVSCPAGTTVKYSRAYFRDDSDQWRDPLADSTTASYSINTSYEGYQYNVRVQAICSTTYISSSYSATATGPTYIRNVDPPGLAAGFNVSKTTVGSGYGGTYETASIYWDTIPTCGTGLARREQILPAYSYVSTSSVIPSGTGWYDIFTTGSDLNQWKTQWQASLKGTYKNASEAPSPTVVQNLGTGWKDWVVTSTNRAGVASSGVFTDGASSRLDGFRAYVRYACVNTTTNRYGVGGPALTNWYSW